MNHIEIADLSFSTVLWSGEEEKPRADEEEPMEVEEADGEIDELMEIEHEPIMEQNYVGAGLRAPKVSTQLK